MKKVLMLHGYAQSGEIFKAKTGGLRKALGKLGYELCYPCGPEKIELIGDDDIGGKKDGTELYGWWKRDPRGNYTISERTWGLLRDCVLQEGPFEGIIGFSQGAGLAGYLCTDVCGLLGITATRQPDFKFFINFSGFQLEPKRYWNAYTKEALRIPSLHIIGELDTIVDESRVMALYNACPTEYRFLLKHVGGHFVPNTKPFLAKIVAWLASLEGAQSA